MKNMNGLQLQELLRKETYLSVPRLQVLLGLRYQEARELLEKLLHRGWIKAPAEDLGYPVHQENMQLHKLSPDDVDGLIENITENCVEILKCLKEKGDEGSTHRELETAAYGRTSALKAFLTLVRYRLVYKYEDHYFLSVSYETVEVLEEVCEKKCCLEEIDEKMQLEMCRKELRKLFDKLFSDS